MILLIFLGYIQTKYSPFYSKVLNELENRSLLACVTCLFFTAIYNNKTDELTRVVTSIIILLVNIFFLYIWIIQVLSTQYENIVSSVSCWPNLKNTIVNIKKEFDLLEIEYKKKHNLGITSLTAEKKVRLSISKVMKRISDGLANQKKSIGKRLSKMAENLGYNRKSININKT